METLAIIAYRQPVTKAVIEFDPRRRLRSGSRTPDRAAADRRGRAPGDPRASTPFRHDAPVSSAGRARADRRPAAGGRERGAPRLRVSATPPERLNRFLARRGVASRRGADTLIADGRVTVNGERAYVGAVVDPSADRVSVDGHRIPARAVSVTIVLNKPVGVVTTRSDPYQRTTVMDLIEPVPGLVPIGRLDADSRGLLVLTTDGDLAHAVSHPRHGVTKRYVATLDRAISNDAARTADHRRPARGWPGQSTQRAALRLGFGGRGGHGRGHESVRCADSSQRSDSRCETSFASPSGRSSSASLPREMRAPCAPPSSRRSAPRQACRHRDESPPGGRGDPARHHHRRSCGEREDDARSAPCHDARAPAGRYRALLSRGHGRGRPRRDRPR